MKRIILILLVGFLFFGCIDLGGVLPPADDDGTTSGAGTSGGIIIDQTKNISVLFPDEDYSNLPGSPGFFYEPKSNLYVYFIDLNTKEQGDAILIRKGDFDMLIDTGPESGSGELVDFLKGKIDDIEILVLTHGDPEHYGGANKVLDNIAVEMVWWNGDANNKEYYFLIQSIEDKDIPVTSVSSGEDYTLNGITFNVLNPPSTLSTFEDADNLAIAMKITDRDFCLMTTSVILFGAQSKIINTHKNLQCDIMQVPFHGLGDANIQLGLFLVYVKPKDAIISGNGADPSDDIRSTKDQLETHNAEWHEAYPGTLKITSDGYTYYIN